MIDDPTRLDALYEDEDPWGYESNEHDRRRKSFLLSEIPSREYDSTLDVGCGHGFITRELPGGRVIGVDLSHNAIQQAQRVKSDRHTFIQGSLFDLRKLLNEKFDLITICGVLYPQYIGKAHTFVYHTIDELLAEGGVLISVHNSEWYSARFPYLRLKEIFYEYREYMHMLEVYVKS